LIFLSHKGKESFLAIPGTYVVDKNNEIIYASINPNWMERTEMKEYLDKPHTPFITLNKKPPPMLLSRGWGK